MSTNSQSSRHKSRLLREMSRDLNRSIHSVASSTGSNHGTVSTDSTMTDFNPEKDDAIMSTCQLDNNFSQRLPELRTTAKKYGRWAPREQPSVVINTSAIGRAFPGFSEGDSSDDSMSLEVVRGPKARKGTTPNKAPYAEYSDNVNSSPVVTIGNIKILNTPKRTLSKASILQEALRNSAAKKEITPRRDTASHKENIPPLSSQTSAPVSPYVSHATRATSDQRKSLAELHARVADESDGSFIGDERPVTVTFETKNTRFSNGKSQVSHSANVSSKRQELEEALAERLRSASGTPSKPQTKPHINHTNNSTTPNPTQQSFLLPHMHEMSDVISGAFSNGVSLSTRSGRVLSRSQNGVSGTFSRDAVDGIPVPDEEHDIYMNIDLLKEKVAQLEMEKADYQNTINDLRRDTYQLQAEHIELKKRERADSALGMADGGSDAGSSRATFKLQAEIAILKSDLATRERKESNLELRLKTNTIERDQAVAQLAQAYNQNDQLEAENRSLREQKLQLQLEIGDLKNENQIIRNHLTQFVSEAQDATQTTGKENADLTNENGILKKERSELENEVEALRKELEESVKQRRENVQRQSTLQKTIEQNELELQQVIQEKHIIAMTESRLREKVQRDEEVIRKLQDMTHEIRETTREIKFTSQKEGPTSRHSNKTKRKLVSHPSEQDLASKIIDRAQRQLNQMKSASAESGRRSTGPTSETELVGASTRPRSSSNPQSRSEKVDRDTSSTQKPLKGKPVQTTHLDNDADFEASFDGNTTTDTTIHKDTTIDEGHTIDTEEGSDYASIVGPGFMRDLRRQVNEVRAAKKEMLAAAAAAPSHDDTVHTVQSGRSSHAPSIKGLTGILKNRGTQDLEDLTGRFSIKSSGRVEEEQTTQSNISLRRHRSDPSIHTRDNRRRRNETDDMTSAFIIPDISFNANANGPDHPSLSASARLILDGLCKHDCNNCTVCTRVASFNSNKHTKQTVQVSKPVPVSDRMPVPEPYEDEPTIRPSVEPGLALATVIKGLRDEVVHLKIKHASVLSSYNKHDSSLGMRSRKALKTRLDELLKIIEVKSDQIYALHDVLEGQKQSGQEMSEKEVEVTLLSIGVDPEEHQKGEEDDASDEELPWEGIDETS